MISITPALRSTTNKSGDRAEECTEPEEAKGRLRIRAKVRTAFVSQKSVKGGRGRWGLERFS